MGLAVAISVIISDYRMGRKLIQELEGEEGDVVRPGHDALGWASIVAVQREFDFGNLIFEEVVEVVTEFLGCLYRGGDGFGGL